MKSNKLTPIALAVLVVSNIAVAQSDKSLSPVVVTGSPIIESNNVDVFSGFSTRVTDTQIKELGSLDLQSALRMTPGVQISRYSEVGSYVGDQGASAYIRGLGMSRPGSEIKTYLDGIPVYMGIWNHPVMDLLPLNGVQAITINKGPQNEVNGNNFGSINLESKKPTEDGVHGGANVSVGSYATHVAQANVLGKLDNVDFMIAAGSTDTNGSRANADGRMSNALGSLGIKLNNVWSAGVSFLTVNNKVGDPGDNRYPTVSIGSNTCNPSPACKANYAYGFSNGVSRADLETNLVTAFIKHQEGNLKGEFRVYENTGHNNMSNDPNYGAFNTSFNMSGFKWKEEFSPWSGGQLKAGIDQDNVKGSVQGPNTAGYSGGVDNVPTFRVTSAYVGMSQDMYVSNDWVVRPSAGIRYYDSNVYASKAAPNVGVSLITNGLTVFANYNEGLLYPGAETYSLVKALPFMFPSNSGWNTLSPEKDKHSEIGFKWDLSSRTQISASVFEDRISDRYVWNSQAAWGMSLPALPWSNSSTITSYPSNYKISGAEISLMQQITNNWSIFGGVTTLDPSVAYIPYAPKVNYSLGVKGVVSGFNVLVDAQHQSGMYSSTQAREVHYDPTTNHVGAFTVANARVSYPVAQLGKKGEVYAGINNMFNANYEYNSGYPMPSRNYRVGLIASF